VEFNEIQLQTDFNNDFQFVYTNSNTYQYKFANLRWQPVRTILSFPLINPPTFSLPITVPNALGRETEYQAYLTQVQGLPNNIHIQDHYWDSVNSTPANTLRPTRVNTPSTGSDTDYWTPTNFQFVSPTPESGSTNLAVRALVALTFVIVILDSPEHPRRPPVFLSGTQSTVINL